MMAVGDERCTFNRPVFARINYIVDGVYKAELIHETAPIIQSRGCFNCADYCRISAFQKNQVQVFGSSFFF